MFKLNKSINEKLILLEIILKVNELIIFVKFKQRIIVI